MNKLPIRKVHTGNRILDDAQRTAQDVTQIVNALPFIGGRLLTAEDGQPNGTGLVFATGVTRSVAHGLGRSAVGWIEAYGAALATAAHVGLKSELPAPGTSPATHITVTPTTTGRCFLYVF